MKIDGGGGGSQSSLKRLYCRSVMTLSDDIDRLSQEQKSSPATILTYPLNARTRPTPTAPGGTVSHFPWPGYEYG